MKKVLMLMNDTTYAYNLRSAVIERLISGRVAVVVVAQLLQHQDQLRRLGARLVGVATGRHGTNPISDLLLMRTYKRILREEHPDAVLTYNIKPNIYGGMACRQLNIPYFPNITGLGTPVEHPGLLQKITIPLYRQGVAGAACIFFQNRDNRDFFVQHHMLRPGAKTRLLPGSGVDVNRYPVLPWPEEACVHFLYAGRVMKEKGIDLFLAAARRYADKNVVFDVCGACDDERYLSLLQKEKSIVYHAEQRDMTPFYQKCSCFLFPSYYPEGMSNVLLEAAASGRPVIAADRPGCRETLEDGVTGFLVPIKDEQAVLEAVEKTLRMSVAQRKEMGLRGSEKVRREFNRELVVQAYLEELQSLEGSV